MFVIFGWRSRIKNHGPAYVTTCPNCSALSTFDYRIHRRWFSLYHLPVVPVERYDLLVCPTCRRGPVVQKEHRADAKQLAATYAAWQRGEITESQYREAAADIWWKMQPDRGPAPPHKGRVS